MIQTDDFNIYFAGDTSWGQHFEQIGKEFKDIDVAFTAYSSRRTTFLDEGYIILMLREAVQACIELNAKTFIPMHWGTFHLGFDEYFAPIELLKKSWKAMQVKAADKFASKKLRILKFGELATDLTQKIIISVASKTGQISV